MPRRRRIKPGDEVTIIRLPKVGNFLVVTNAIFEDENLSWEARGLLGYLLSKPDNWQVRYFDLLRRGPAGQYKIRRMLRELEAAGHLRRRRMRHSDRTFSWTITIFESPAPASTID